MLFISTQKQHDVFIQKRAITYRTTEAMNKNIPEILMTTGEITKKMTQTDEQGKLISGKMKQKCYKIHENIINYNELFKRC
jgi:hypothetical protein